MIHYLYRIENPNGETSPDSPVGMVSIPDESYAHRVPENAIKVTDKPMIDDKDGAYFEAWRIGDDGSISVDFEAAKTIRLETLRKRRNGLFKGLDQQQFRAYCSKDEKLIGLIEEEKDRLRDCPERIDWDSCKTVKELNFIMPPELV